MVYANFESILKAAKEVKRQRIVLIMGGTEQLKFIVKQCISENLADFIVLDTKEGLKHYNGMPVFTIPISNIDSAMETALDMISQNKADIIMKGNLESAFFLKPILNKERNIIKRRLSQVSVIEKEDGGFLFISDCAIAQKPNLEEKIEIIENLKELTAALGIDAPKIAILSATETVNVRLPASIDAAILTVMNQRGQIKDCIIDGPLALDNAVSSFSANEKGIKGIVAGNADAIIVPDLITGNAITKTLTHLAGKTVLAVTLGTKKPIVFTSRTESNQGKLYSIAISILLSGRNDASNSCH